MNEAPSDPVIVALHNVLSKVYGDNDNEAHQSFLELRRRLKEKLKIQDIIGVPIVQEVCSDPAIISHAIRTYNGFFVRNEMVKQHHDKMPQNSVLLRDMPAQYSNAELIALFQSLVLPDGSPCPLPVPEKIRSDGTTWLAVFQSVQDASNALTAVRNKIGPDGKNFRAVPRNETAKVMQVNQMMHKRDGAMPTPYHQNLSPVQPPYPMYGQTALVPTPIYYAHPSTSPFGGFYQYPQYPMHPYQMPVAYPMHPSGYPMHQAAYFDPSMAYNMPAPPQSVPYLSNNSSSSNNNNINSNVKPRRMNNNNYVAGNNNNNNNNRPYQMRNNQMRYSKSDDNMGSPGAMATEVAVAALDSMSSIPRSFSADADEAGKEHQQVEVPVVTVPVAEEPSPSQDPVVPVEVTPIVSNEEQLPGDGVHPDGEINGKESGNEKSPTVVPAAKESKKDGANRGARSSKDAEGRRNGRDNKGRQEKEAKKERKTPPPDLSLEKDFPTLNIADNVKASTSGKSVFNYANALKRAADESPRVPVSAPMVQPASTSSAGKPSNSKKDKEGRQTSKTSTSSVNAVANGHTTAVESKPVAVPKPVEVVKVEKTLVPPPEPTQSVPENVSTVSSSSPISPAGESHVSESVEQTSGGRKTFIDAVRAKK